MPSLKRNTIILTVLILIAAACTLTSTPDTAPRATITAIPTNTRAPSTPTPPAPVVTEIIAPTITPAIPPTDDNPLYTLTPGEGVLYFENFQRDQVPYWLFTIDAGFSYLDGGDLYINLLEPGKTVITTLEDLPPETTTVDMWAKISHATGQAAIGMSCRVDPEAFDSTGYHIGVYLDGTVRAYAATPEGRILLHERLITDPTFDLSKWTFFHLKCDGDVFYFTANGIPVFSGPITDPIYTEGVFGVIVWGEVADSYDQFAIQVFSASGP